MRDHSFRILFAALWVAFFAVRIHYQRKMPKGRTYTRVRAAREICLFKAFALGYLAVALYAVTPWLDAGSVALGAAVRWAGAAIALLGIAYFGWAHAALGANWTAVPALSPEHQLVTSGPYRRVRHPMYSAFIAIGIGLSLVAANWIVAVLYLGTMLPMYFLRVAGEEQMMLDRFGDEYRRYVAATGRLFPRLQGPPAQ